MIEYTKELLFVKRYLENMAIPFHIVNMASDENLLNITAFGPHSIVFSPERLEEYSKLLSENFVSNVLYRITGELLCRYFVFLPPGNIDMLCVIGPYINEPVTQPQINNISLLSDKKEDITEALREYYDRLTLVTDDTYLLALMNTLCESIWESFSNFMLRDINNHVFASFEAISEPSEAKKHADTEESSFARMTALQERYDAENMMLEAVSKGEMHRAEMLFQSFISLQRPEKRTSDAIRNTKNYTIILNTLLRKAAEQGKVHPLHLDRTSAAIAEKIENAKTSEEVSSLGREMVRKYCLLVRNHSMSKYSQLIQQALTIINGDLTAELTLNSIAEELHVNASYLSATFKKELGVTLTDYVTQKRINHAIFLINSSGLPINSVAAKCGIPDIQYFSKLFKKRLGMSPSQYRKMIAGGS